MVFMLLYATHTHTQCISQFMRPSALRDALAAACCVKKFFCANIFSNMGAFSSKGEQRGSSSEEEDESAAERERGEQQRGEQKGRGSSSEEEERARERGAEIGPIGKITFVRHSYACHSAAKAVNKLIRDPALTESGLQTVRDICEYHPWLDGRNNRKPYLIFSSQLLRGIETALEIRKCLLKSSVVVSPVIVAPFFERTVEPVQVAPRAPL